MANGRQVYRDIESHVGRAREQLDRASNGLQQATNEQDKLRAAETRSLAALARVRLDELAADRVAGGLDSADRRALDLLERRAAAASRVNAAIAASREHQAELQTAHDEARAGAERAKVAHDEQVEATLARLSDTDDYQRQLAKTERATNQAARATKKAEIAETDRDEKRKPYEADKLFSYLWKRRYRFPEYRAIPMIRSLDAWVAGLCAYDKAHRDYGLLLAIPDRLREHSRALVEAGQVEAEALRAIEKAAMEADGVPALATALADAGHRLEQVDDEIVACEREHDDLVARQAALDRGEDSDSRAAVGAILDQLRREDVATLESDARRTPTAEDDRVVREIDGLRKRIAEVNERIPRLRADHDKALKSLQELEELRRRFRRHGYDSSDSLFDGFDGQHVLGSLLTGALVLGQVWSIFGRHQRFRRRRRFAGLASDVAIGVLGSLLSSGSSSSSGFGGGSTGGGGFGGGGGFTTGGGFGGDSGGFETGGGF